MRNVEIKARIINFKDFLSKASQISDGPAVVLNQTDTYFKVSHGRLKLRQINVINSLFFLISIHSSFPNSFGTSRKILF